MTRHGHIALAIGSAMLGLLVIFLHIDRKPKTVMVSLPAGPAQPRLSPGEAGLDPAALESAVAYAGPRRTTALVVGHGGHIVFEKYWDETTLDTPVAPGFGRSTSVRHAHAGLAVAVETSAARSASASHSRPIPTY